MSALSVRRRVSVLAATAAVALGGGLGTAPASAAGPMTCEFNGVAWPRGPVPVMGGNAGAYSFAGSFNCVTSSGVRTNIPASSFGVYDNIQCGTGTFSGSIDISGVAAFDYWIEVAGGQGLLTVTSDGDLGHGAVSMLPQPGGCVTGPATHFTIYGDVTGLFT